MNNFLRRHLESFKARLLGGATTPTGKKGGLQSWVKELTWLNLIGIVIIGIGLFVSSFPRSALTRTYFGSATILFECLWAFITPVTVVAALLMNIKARWIPAWIINTAVGVFWVLFIKLFRDGSDLLFPRDFFLP